MYKAKFNIKIQIIQLSAAQREAPWLFAARGKSWINLAIEFHGKLGASKINGIYQKQIKFPLVM